MLVPAKRKMPDLGTLHFGDKLSIHRGRTGFIGVATVFGLIGDQHASGGQPRRAAYVFLNERAYRVREDGILQRIPSHEPTVMYVKARYGD